MSGRRVLDVVVAFPAMLVTAPVISLAMLVIWLEDRHPPLFLATRVGQGGRVFTMFKLRTMIPDAQWFGGSSTAAGDRRLTRVGPWLRRWKIDELPQLWNVLHGDMALIGPRPQVPAGVARYTPEERRLLSVRPGLSDPASIVFADEAEILAGERDADEAYDRLIRPWKSRLALAGIDHAGLGSDLALMALTALAIVARPWALRGLAALMDRWGVPLHLSQVCLRREPLTGMPPPGWQR